MSQQKAQENLVNKVSVATVYGKIKTIIKQTDEGDERVLEKECLIMRVIGQANGYLVKNSQFGDSLEFKGMFKAINLETGEIFRAGKCFLPKVFEDHLGSMLDQIESGAEFALDVAVIPAKNAFGYEYRVRPLLEVKESPVLARLESLIPNHLQLAAPAATRDEPVNNADEAAKKAQAEAVKKAEAEAAKTGKGGKK